MKGIKVLSVKDFEGFEFLDPLQNFAAENMERVLKVALNLGVIEEDQHIKGKVVDFGAGHGGSTWYLKNLGADVTAVDLEDMSELRNINVLPDENIVIENGIKYLNELPENSVDMIISIMFGPDKNGDLSRQFIPVALKSLRVSGVILVFSEIGTISVFDKIAQNSSVRLDNNTRLLVKGKSNNYWSSYWSGLQISTKKW
jgi:spermidine synthase